MIVIATLTVVVCLKKRPSKVYKVSEEENSKRKSTTTSEPHQCPMGAQVFDLPLSNTANQMPVWDNRPSIISIGEENSMTSKMMGGDDLPDSSTMIGNHDVVTHNTHTTTLSPIQEFQAYIEHHPESSGYSSFIDPHTHNNSNFNNQNSASLPNSSLTKKSKEQQPQPAHRSSVDSSLVIASPEHEVFDRLEGYSEGSPSPQLFEISVDDRGECVKENLGESATSVATMTINATPEPLLPPNGDPV